MLGDMNPASSSLLTRMAGEICVAEHRASKHLYCAPCNCHNLAAVLRFQINYKQKVTVMPTGNISECILLSVLYYVVSDLWNSK